jgi:DNA mismatch endonuclease (patch repair protein)
MSRVKGRDTKPEKIVRSLLHGMGYRFRLNQKSLPGSPDIVLPKYKKAVFVHGCFWHGHEGCQRAARPTSNADFWNQKIEGNIKRDSVKLRELRKLGWKATVIWQCQIRDMHSLQKRLDRFLQSKDLSYIE